MSKLDLSSLSVPDAQLIQHGLHEQGFYDGTYLGKPGPITQAAYDRYRQATDGKPTTASSPDGKSVPQLLIEVLLAEEGVREVPKNSNSGPRVREYQQATWLDGTGWPWCAAFLCWGLQQVEATLGGQGQLGFIRPQTAGAWDFENWARQQGLKLFKPKSVVRAGDIICFTFSHIGLAVEDEKNGSVKTVEGNTDQSASREGGGVYVQTRSTGLIRSHIRLEKA